MTASTSGDGDARGDRALRADGDARSGGDGPVIRVLLADDERMLRGAVASLLNLEPDLTVVAEAADGVEAIRLAEQTRPHVAILDLEMPPGDGITAAARLEMPVVLVTRHSRPAVLRRALAAGVRGFVPKSAPASQLASIIREVHGGRRYVDPDTAESALGERPCPLTDRELQVLRAARLGGSLVDIAETVHLAQGTVRNYLSSAMAKLNVQNRHAAALAAWEQGWI